MGVIRLARDPLCAVVLCLSLGTAANTQPRLSTFEFELTGQASPALARLTAYAQAVEKSTGERVFGSDALSRFDEAKRIVLEDGKGAVAQLEVIPSTPGAFRVSGQWSPQLDARKDARALRLMLDVMGNPGIMVVMLEANGDREVLRPVSDARIKRVLLEQGFRIQAAPRVYLDHLSDIRKQFEFRRRASLDVTVAQPLGTTIANKVDEEYMIAWRDMVLGQGNDKATLDAARAADASFVLVGDSYAHELPLPPAAAAWAQQGYRQARAQLTFQVMSVNQQVLAASGAENATEMDLSLDAAGTKAIAAAAARVAEHMGVEIAANIRSRDLRIK
jgi:hypothetical protein